MTAFSEDNSNYQFDFEFARGVFDFNERSEIIFSGLEFICSKNKSDSSPQISRIRHIYNILPLDGSDIKDTVVEGFYIQNKSFNIGNIKEPIRIGRFFQALQQLLDLFNSSAFISLQKSSPLDTFSDVKEQKLPVLFSLLASVGQYTIKKSKTSERDNKWSRSAALNTRADTMFLQCTQCPMRISLQDLFRISSFKPTNYTAKLLGKLSVQHDAECPSRLAIHRLRSEEVHHPIEEGKLEFSMKSIGNEFFI